jgi:hypothetical protein
VSRGQHAAGDRSFNRSAGGAMARGVALVVAAVLIGVVLLNQTDDPGVTAVATSGTTTTTSTTAAPVKGATTTTTSTAPKAARNPSEVTVMVANGSGVTGAARTVSTKVAAANYLTAPPADAATVAAASTVYFLPGYELDAKAVAALFKPVPKTAPMPATPPVKAGGLGAAQVLVVIAVDLAKG